MHKYGRATIGIFLLTILPYLGAHAQTQIPQDLIRLNQVGFYPAGPKTAVIEKNISGSFYVISSDGTDTLYSAPLSAPQKHPYGPRTVRLADFSAFNTTGSYKLLVPGVGQSHPFEIGAEVHKHLGKAAIKSYYFQRASTSLPQQYAGKWHRQLGHPDDKVLIHASAASRERPEGNVITSTKGWYDAGDYNKYVVNSGITMGTMLSLIEDYPGYSNNIELDIPEKTNQLPDLLDELLWNLRWMLTMQDPNDGGIYHKMTSAGFAGMVMPAADTDARYVVQKSVTAALDFAAVMAQASRVVAPYEQHLPGLSDSCLTAAKEAWKWARQHPEQLYRQGELNKKFNPDVTTGAYGDGNAQDEFTWAAAELYITTGDEKYYNATDMLTGEQLPLPSWGQVRALGYYSLLRFSDQLEGAAEENLPEIRQRVITFADDLVTAGNKSAYRVAMGHSPQDFVWGSNAVAANQGIALIQAYRLTSDTKYIDAAVSSLDYLMGRNGTSFAFVTGHGDKTPMHPHHRPSEADGINAPVPGLMAGGPNPGQQDGCKYPSDIADQSYVDAECSYASNEIAINWNAPLVYLTNAIEALQYEVGYSKR